MGFILDGLDTEDYDRQYSDRDLLKRIVAYFKPHGPRMLLVGIGKAFGKTNNETGHDNTAGTAETADDAYGQGLDQHVVSLTGRNAAQGDNDGGGHSSQTGAERYGHSGNPV